MMLEVVVNADVPPWKFDTEAGSTILVFYLPHMLMVPCGWSCFVTGVSSETPHPDEAVKQYIVFGHPALVKEYFGFTE
jgi:hypothetical protein